MVCKSKERQHSEAGGRKKKKKKNSGSKGTGAESYTCLSFKYKAGFRKTKGTQYCNICSGLVWHVNLSVFPSPACLLSFPLRVWRGVRFLLRHKTQVSGKKTERKRERKKDETAVRPVKICRELCLTKCSNIILSSRISTHASKVHLPSLFLSFSF